MASKLNNNYQMDIESIIEPLISFLLSSKNSPIPRECTAISILFAKIIRQNNIPISHNTTHELSLPISIYYGIIHPSSEINKFCRNKMNETHNKLSINNFDDYTNIITPIIHIIRKYLAFMRYTIDIQQLDKKERNTKINQNTIKLIQSNTNSTVQYAEQHLYDGLKLIINNHLLTDTEIMNDLINIILQKVNVNNINDIESNCEQLILISCVNILKKIDLNHRTRAGL